MSIQTIVPIIIFIVLIGICYIFYKQMKSKIQAVQSIIKNYENSTEKLVNVTYIAELEELNIKDLDNNISTIIIKNELNKTDKVRLLSSLCESLEVEIEHYNIKEKMFLSCFKKDCFSALILDDKKITIACQDFDFLLILHGELSNLLNKNFNNNIQKTI
jgi:hypothetical protein